MIHSVRLNALEDRDDAVAYVCAHFPADQREAAFRGWCRYHRHSVLRSDLERLKEARHGEQQRPLFD